MSKIYHDFFNQGLFTFEELRRKYLKKNTERTLRNMIYQELKRGELGQVKSGLYFVIPPGMDKQSYRPDPYKVASKLGQLSVLAYHSALTLQGAAYSDSNRVYFFSSSLTRGFEFQEIEYVPIQEKVTWGTQTITREGLSVVITDRERTVLDCVDRPEYAGGFEELIKSIEMFPSLDFLKLEIYLKKKNKNFLYSKIGFILELLKERWHVPQELLYKIERHSGKGVYYFEAKKGNAKFVPKWGLMVPKTIESLLQGV